MRDRMWLVATLLLACMGAASAQPANVTPLTPAGVPALMQPPAHGERIIMLWALDCLYCEPNMQELAKLQRAHPKQVQLVFVATDNVANDSDIAARVAAAGVQGYPVRAYAEPTPARLNFLIDPNWGGEMPRTIVVRADGTRVAISGVLTADQLRRIKP